MKSEKKIRHSKEWYYKARFVAYGLGIVFCVLPTLIAAMYELPVIVDKSAESTLSGVFIAALVVAALPLYKALLRLLKNPSAAMICWLFFILMFFAEKMSEQTEHGLMLVFLWAAIGNTLGVICFNLSKEFEKLWQHCGQVEIVGKRLRGESK